MRTFDPYHLWLGIQPYERPLNYYRLLGLSPLESDPLVIENAANRQMRHVQSFSTGPHSAESQEVLIELTKARDCLADPTAKADYDASNFAPPPVKPAARAFDFHQVSARLADNLRSRRAPRRSSRPAPQRPAPQRPARRKSFPRGLPVAIGKIIAGGLACGATSITIAFLGLQLVAGFSALEAIQNRVATASQMIPGPIIAGDPPANNSNLAKGGTTTFEPTRKPVANEAILVSEMPRRTLGPPTRPPRR